MPLVMWSTCSHWPWVRYRRAVWEPSRSPLVKLKLWEKPSTETWWATSHLTDGSRSRPRPLERRRPAKITLPANAEHSIRQCPGPPCKLPRRLWLMPVFAKFSVRVTVRPNGGRKQMTASEQYLQSCRDALEKISHTQSDAIRQAADLIAGRVASGGIVFSFGTGHSHELAEEIAYRAGGVVPVNPILEPSLTGSTEVSKSEFLERLEGFAPHILDYHRVGKEDVLIIISNSGRNAAPVEMAIEARSRDIPVVAVTSLGYSQEVSSRHSSGKKLYQVADIVLDNCTPYGDAVVNLPDVPQPVGPLSTVAGAALLHAVMVSVAERLAQKMSPVPVFWSGNLDGVTEKNWQMMDPYRARVRFW